MADGLSLALMTNRYGCGIHQRARYRVCSKATLNGLTQSHFRAMEGGLSLALMINRYGCGIHQRVRYRVCSGATLVWLTQSHFRLMVVRFSLGLVMSQCYCPPTLERRSWALLAFSHTLDGFSLRLEKAISCLCLLMHCCRTLLISSPFH